jgi:hypothetical protein
MIPESAASQLDPPSAAMRAAAIMEAAGAKAACPAGKAC